MSTVDALIKAIARYNAANRLTHDLTISNRIADEKIHQAFIKMADAIEECRKRVEYHTAVHMRVDNWLPACNGTETPFQTRTGRTLLYCWNPATGKHGYIDTRQDLLLSDEDARIALGV